MERVLLKSQGVMKLRSAMVDLLLNSSSAGDGRMRDLRDKTALVTGGAKRIGREVCLALSRAGAGVVIHYNNSSKEAFALAAEIEADGGQAWTIRADFRKQDELASLIERTTSLCGALNMLVNSASVYTPAEFSSLGLEDVIDGVRSEAWSACAIARQFAEHDSAEHIVNMLDSRVVTGIDWKHAGYYAGKRLLRDFTRMMALYYAPRIAVNAVAPGLILPPADMDEGIDSYMEGQAQRLPLKKRGQPAFIAEAVLYLLQSEFLTGQILFVDGGLHLTGAVGGQDSYS